ncbi:metallophosphoesterase [Candidatus Aerophobetes bacterium]|nr:metallophosphoesterase [Candidatus Aerophobetes bacterium]
MKKIKILAVADKVHPVLYDYFDKERYLDIDLILSAGDIRPGFLSFLVSMLNKRCFYVRGNHDIIYDERPPLGCENIDGKIVCYNGIRILGFEGSMWYGGRGVEYTERQMRRKVFSLQFKLLRKEGVDIILTHAPPKGIHDGRDICHSGFSSFMKLIEKYKPSYFIHGHTHTNYGYSKEKVTELEGTKVVNADGYYIFEIEPSSNNKLKKKSKIFLKKGG